MFLIKTLGCWVNGKQALLILQSKLELGLCLTTVQLDFLSNPCSILAYIECIYSFSKRKFSSSKSHFVPINCSILFLLTLFWLALLLQINLNRVKIKEVSKYMLQSYLIAPGDKMYSLGHISNIQHRMITSIFSVQMFSRLFSSQSNPEGVLK